MSTRTVLRPASSPARLSCPGRSVDLLLREGFVDEEFVDLARARRDEAQEARLDLLERALAERVLARPAAEVLELSSR